MSSEALINFKGQQDGRFNILGNLFQLCLTAAPVVLLWVSVSVDASECILMYGQGKSHLLPAELRLENTAL